MTTIMETNKALVTRYATEYAAEVMAAEIQGDDPEFRYRAAPHGARWVIEVFDVDGRYLGTL